MNKMNTRRDEAGHLRGRARMRAASSSEASFSLQVVDSYCQLPLPTTHVGPEKVFFRNLMQLWVRSMRQTELSERRDKGLTLTR